MSKLLVKFPTRARLPLFQHTLGLYQDRLSGKHEVHFRVSVDEDDAVMNNARTLGWLESMINVSYAVGHSKSKVEAINADLAGQSFDVLLLASDDMLPVVDGYDDVIISDMESHFPRFNGVLHYNDGRRGRELNTLSIMGRALYDRWGHIYHPDYQSLWCDDEFTQVSTRDGVSAYIDRVIIRHAWKDATGADALHVRNEALFHRDKAVFETRLSRGFPKESCLSHVVFPGPPPPPAAPLPPLPSRRVLRRYPMPPLQSPHFH